MQEDNDPFADLKHRGAQARRKYEDAKARGDESEMNRAGLALTAISRSGQKRAHELRAVKEHLIARYEGINAENRETLAGLEERRFGTHHKVIGDKTEADKVLYRKFIEDTDALIERIRMWGLG